MRKSHTNTAELKIIPGLGLADLAGSGLPERLAGKVEGELELFADRMRQAWSPPPWRSACRSSTNSCRPR